MSIAITNDSDTFRARKPSEMRDNDQTKPAAAISRTRTDFTVVNTLVSDLYSLAATKVLCDTPEPSATPTSARRPRRSVKSARIAEISSGFSLPCATARSSPAATRRMSAIASFRAASSFTCADGINDVTRLSI